MEENSEATPRIQGWRVPRKVFLMYSLAIIYCLTSTASFTLFNRTSSLQLHRDMMMDPSLHRAPTLLCRKSGGGVRTAASYKQWGPQKFTSRMPKLVWLMSFPNSGTSYSLRQVELLSNYSMASNYGSNGERTELLYKDQPYGPRCRGLLSGDWPRSLPPEYVLVKTHCNGYATNAGARAIKRNQTEFSKGCATTMPLINGSSSMKGTYDTRLVKKAVHMIRNPFDNIISRFNCEHKLSEREGGRRANFSNVYSKNAQGFRSFCNDIDSDFEHQYTKRNLSMYLSHHVKRTMCHDEFISYVMWHNNAFETTRALGLPTLIVYYEDFELDLLDFLHLEENGLAEGFNAKHYTHNEYFTTAEQHYVKKMLKLFASNHTWRALARYFVETD